MTIFDLLFLATVAICASALVVGALALALGHWTTARAVFLGLGAYALIYTLALVGVGALSPQRTLPLGQARCYDDWCVAVAHTASQATVGAGTTTATARGRFLIVTLQVSSHAKRVSQREHIASLYLLDDAGHRYDVAPAGQRALDASGQAGQPLDSLVGPGASFTHTLVFDIPADATHLGLVITHSAFPGALIIGDEQSVFHRPTLMLLNASS
ncbi:MAG TPA: DUF4352 domain-containing protein [Ktedonobacterales bacterium]|nr:DUF4352 domain-containing protein [Ktedonobacterales bacterium]